MYLLNNYIIVDNKIIVLFNIYTNKVLLLRLLEKIIFECSLKLLIVLNMSSSPLLFTGFVC